jgi:hypothetical protein
MYPPSTRLSLVPAHVPSSRVVQEPMITIEHPQHSRAAQLFARNVSLGTALDMHLCDATAEDFELQARLTKSFEAAIREMKDPRLSGLHIGLALLDMARVQMLMYADDDPFGHEL